MKYPSDITARLKFKIKKAVSNENLPLQIEYT